MRIVFRVFLSVCLLLPSFPLRAQEVLEEAVEPSNEPLILEEVIEENDPEAIPHQVEEASEQVPEASVTDPVENEEESPVTDPLIEDPPPENTDLPAESEDLPQEIQDPLIEEEPPVSQTLPEDQPVDQQIPPEEDAPDEVIEDPLPEPEDPESLPEGEPPESEPELTSSLVINEVLRGSEINPERDHFIELYNYGDQEISLAGWQIRGVTSGGTWIDVTNGEATGIQPQSYFVLSRYTNSSSSVLASIPGSNKSSVLIPEGDILIELRNPEGVIVDRASIIVEDVVSDVSENGSQDVENPIYRAYERVQPFGDELDGGQWALATVHSNLKESVSYTFATPASENSDFLLIGEVSELNYELVTYDSDESLLPLTDLYLSWLYPDDPWLSSVRLYQLDEYYEDKTLLSEFLMSPDSQEEVDLSLPDSPQEDPLPESEPVVEQEEVIDLPLEETDSPTDPSEEEFLPDPRFQDYWLYDIDPTLEMVFQVTTVDIFGRESWGEYLTITPEYRVVISEILPDPKTKDTQNEFIELWNLSPFPVDLYDWELDDSNQTNNHSYFFIDEFRDYLLMPGDFIVFDRYETGITLGNQWDEVILYDADGFEVDYYLYLAEPEGRSHARDHDNPDEWIILNHPTPGEPNIEFNQAPIPRITFQGGSNYMSVNVTGEDSYDLEGDDMTYFWDFGDGHIDDRRNPLSYTYQTPGEKYITLTVTDEFGMNDFVRRSFTATLKSVSQKEEKTPSITYPSYQPINEFIPNPEGKDTESEWIELFNHTSSVMDLSGWYLDDGEGATSPKQIPPGTLLQPGEYLVFSAPEFNLSLKNSEDVVRLLDPNKNPKHTISYSESQEAYSYAKTPEGSFKWTPLLSPGEFNQFPLPPKSYPVDSVVFQKILPNPDGKDDGQEKMVLKNTTNASIDLTDWVVADNQNHDTILTSLSILPNAELILNQEDFQFSLNNGEETLFLYDPAGNLIDQISWKDAPSGQWVFDLDLFVDGMEASVRRVIDGDTLDIDWQGHMFRVRLIGVDTPETVHPFKPVEFYGKKASDYLKQLLSHQTITLEFDHNKMDRYGRLLAYVYLDDLFVNASIIQQGYGRAYTRFPFVYLHDFVAHEQAARQAGLGMWEDEETALLVEEKMEEAIEEKIKEEEALEKDLEEGLDEKEPEAMVIFEEKTPEKESESEEKSSIPLRDCSNSQLMIDAFMPNAEKGVSVEWIRIVNVGEEKACLDGWQLDDIPEGGSNPFSLPSQWLESGQTHTFEKTDTRLSLNNKDDSVVLIHPSGRLVDRIDYGNTHKNEIFTHEGGNWVPKKKQKTSGSSTSKKRFRFGREAIAYAGELTNGILVGTIESIDQENQTLFFLAESGESKFLSYQNIGLDFESLFLMLDADELLQARIYESGHSLQLIDLKPFYEHSLIESEPLFRFDYLVFWLLLIIAGFSLRFFLAQRQLFP